MLLSSTSFFCKYFAHRMVHLERMVNLFEWIRLFLCVRFGQYVETDLPLKIYFKKL